MGTNEASISLFAGHYTWFPASQEAWGSPCCLLGPILSICEMTRFSEMAFEVSSYSLVV